MPRRIGPALTSVEAATSRSGPSESPAELSGQGPSESSAPRGAGGLLAGFGFTLLGAALGLIVIGGNTYTSGYIPTRLWLKYMRLPNGKPPRLDLYGHNPFTARAPNLHNPPSPDGEFDFSDLGRLEHLVNKYLAPPHRVIRLFLSEWLITTAPDIEFNIYTTPAVQAQWIRAAWHIVLKSSWIYALGWVHLEDGHGLMSGLLYANGKKKPGYYAFKSG